MPEPPRSQNGDLSPVFAIIMLVVLAASLGTVGYLWHWADATAAQIDRPRPFAFEADMAQGTLKVVAAPFGMDWTQLKIDGCAAHPAGAVYAGEYISGCAGTVSIVDVAGNRVVGHYLFP